jgi:hypothetical protein
MATIPTGTYPAKPTRVNEEGPFARLGVSKQKKSNQILIWFEITDGPYKGSKLPWFGYFTEDSAERTIDSLRLCGFTGQDIYDIENQTLDGSVLVQVENTVYKGRNQCRIAWVNDPSWTGDIEIEPMDDKGKKNLNSVLKGIL